MKPADNRARKAEPGAEGFLQGSTKSFQENVSQAGPVAAASYTLVGAIILMALIGYAMDHWLGTSPWFLLVGLLVGMIVGFYELGKVVLRR